MRVTVLGAASVWRAEVQVDLGGPKVRALLAALALYGGRTVSPDRIIDLLWQQDTPPAVTASLQTYVAKLRRALEPDRAARAPASTLLTSNGGYSLHLQADALDVWRFRQSVDQVHRRLLRPADGLPRTPLELTSGDLRVLRHELTVTLALWKDTPFLDLPEEDDAVVAERAGLAARRLIAVEDLALVRIALGEESSVAGDLEPLVAAHPLRESLWGIRILALARSGQQQESLAAARAVRTALTDELGVDPGPMLQLLEGAVLQQSPDLYWQPAGGRSLTGPAHDPATSTTPPAEPGGITSPSAPPAEWPLVGRQTQLARLREALIRARSGQPTAVMLIGEPGIGKSRLLREVAGWARSHGFLVAGGSCSQDEGAPPLWPWSRVFADLDAALPVAPADRIDLLSRPGELTARFADEGDEAVRWDLWEAVLHRLRTAAAAAPLVVMLDDLQWADPSTLILSRHLVERLADPATHAPIALVLTRRRLPEPRGPLARLSETMARTDAVRMDIGGLNPTEVEEFVRAATGTMVDAERARQLSDRTGGNAFFLTEIIRLAQQSSTFDQSEIPSAVSDVVLSRLSTLPDSTRRMIGVAAVIGREFDVVLLAALTGSDVDGVLDQLEPALAIGLVLERKAGEFRFSHALVRDAVSNALPATRRALRHAEIAAALDRGQSLDLRRGRSEAARHWLAAGPAHAATAWRAAAAVAAEALSVLAWEEAADLLTRAIEVSGLDSAAGDRDRYHLRMQLADACRWSGDRTGVNAALGAALADAQRLGDDELAARAAIGNLEGSAWFPRAYAEVDSDRIQVLRELLRRLPAGDSELRCRVMLTLAVELYYAQAPQEITALTEQGLAMAHRIGDPALLGWSSTAAYQATWKPSTAELRYEWMTQAVAAAMATGDARAEAVSRFLLAGAAQETGRIDEMREQIVLSRSLALRHRLATVDVALGWLEASWLALEGKYPEAFALVAQTAEMMKRTSMNQQSEAPTGAAMVIQVIQDRIDDVMVQQFSAVAAASQIPMSANILVVLLRAGRIEEVRRRYAIDGLTLGPESWFSLIADSMAAEVAAELVDRGAGRTGLSADLRLRRASGDRGSKFGNLAGRLVPGPGGRHHRREVRCDGTCERGRAFVHRLGRRQRQHLDSQPAPPLRLLNRCRVGSRGQPKARRSAHSNRGRRIHCHGCRSTPAPG